MRVGETATIAGDIHVVDGEGAGSNNSNKKLYAVSIHAVSSMSEKRRSR